MNLVIVTHMPMFFIVSKLLKYQGGNKLKKFIISTIAGLLILLCFMLPATAAVNTYDCVKSIKMIIGDKKASVNNRVVESDQASYLKSGRTLVPLRFIAEAFKADVTWTPLTRQAMIETNDGTIIKVVVGAKTAFVGSKSQALEVPAEIKGGRVFVPLRFIGESMGAKVDYIAVDETIAITYVDVSDWDEYIEPVTGTKVLFPYWETSSEGSSLILRSDNETDFEFSFESMSVSQLLKLKKNELISEGWQLVSESENVAVLTKKDPNVSSILLTHIISTQKAANGGTLIATVETNSLCKDTDLPLVDKMLPGWGIDD